jgi:hypothetical protein
MLSWNNLPPPCHVDRFGEEDGWICRWSWYPKTYIYFYDLYVILVDYGRYASA